MILQYSILCGESCAYTRRNIIILSRQISTRSLDAVYYIPVGHRSSWLELAETIDVLMSDPGDQQRENLSQRRDYPSLYTTSIPHNIQSLYQSNVSSPKMKEYHLKSFPLPPSERKHGKFNDIYIAYIN